MLLKNDLISVRDFLESDVENKVEWINNSENNEYLHYDLPLEYEKTLAWFRNKNNNGRCDCVIEYNGIPVGLIGLLSIDSFHGKAEFYISMGDTSFKRKGIATVATRLILNYAFCDLGLHKVYLNVDAENAAACKLYEKVGFVCEGFFKEDMIHRGRYIDRKRYAILKKDFTEVGSI